MSQVDAKRSIYMSRLSSIENGISSARSEISGIEREIGRLDQTIPALSTRISKLRQMNFKILSHLEKDQMVISERWGALGPDLKEMARTRGESLRLELGPIEAEMMQRRADQSSEVGSLLGLEARVSTLRIKASSLVEEVTKATIEISHKVDGIEQDLLIAESTIALTAQSSFPWKDGESAVLAVKAKDMNKDTEGVLTLTNQRFIYEKEDEIVLKKRLFIATEKKKVREVQLEKPIGMVSRVTKGRVGLLAGHGLFIEFKPESGLKELKLDTKGDEADWSIRFYNSIISGEVDKELSSAAGGAEPERKPQSLACPRCGAPYVDVVYRGQTTVNCKYCGTVIPIPG